MNFESFRLAASTATLDEEPAARAAADALELRLDLGSNGIDALSTYDGQLPVIATNRLTTAGGKADPGPDRREQLCRAIEQQAVEAVDIELATIQAGDGQRVLEHARANDVATIVSVHDFETTPDKERLRSLLTTACRHGTVGKFAVTATAPEDVLDLLTVTRELTVDGKTVATMAMGAVGRHSRVVAPLYGSRLGYAPVDPANATAPGQYDLETFRTLFTDLSGRE